MWDKCLKLAISCCRPMFSSRNKTSWYIPTLISVRKPIVLMTSLWPSLAPQTTMAWTSDPFCWTWTLPSNCLDPPGVKAWLPSRQARARFTLLFVSLIRKDLMTKKRGDCANLLDFHVEWKLGNINWIFHQPLTTWGMSLSLWMAEVPYYLFFFFQKCAKFRSLDCGKLLNGTLLELNKFRSNSIWTWTELSL